MPEKKTFIGPNEVMGVTILAGRLTPKGNPIVRVIYGQDVLPPGTVEIMPQQTFELLVTPEATDWNYLRETQAKKIQEELAAVVMEWDIQYGDINAIVMNFVEKLFTAFDRATHFLWTGNDSTFIPGKVPLEYRTLLEAEAILKKIPHDTTPKTDTGGDTATPS